MRRTHLLAPGVTLCVLGSAVLPRPLRACARLGAAAYALATVAASASIGARKGTSASDAAALPAVFSTIHLGWGAGFVAGCVRFGPPLAGLARLAGLRRAQDSDGQTAFLVSGPPQPGVEVSSAAVRYGAGAAGHARVDSMTKPAEVLR